MPLFNPRSLYPLSKDQVQLRISKSIDSILQDWIQTLHPSPPPHDYTGIYSPSVTFRIAHDQVDTTQKSGFSLNGRFFFKTAHRMGKMGLWLWINNTYARPRVSCFPEPPPTSPPTELSFRWLIEGIPQSQIQQKGHSLIIGGMAHYKFDDITGRVSSILIDRLIPPFRPGLTILEYLRSLQLQHKSICTIDKSNRIL